MHDVIGQGVNYKRDAAGKREIDPRGETGSRRAYAQGVGLEASYASENSFSRRYPAGKKVFTRVCMNKIQLGLFSRCIVGKSAEQPPMRLHASAASANRPFS